jgi:PPOX class probable F420-dependent enzyme
MAHTMTPEQRREFLMTGTMTGKLAVTRADGSPHVTPVWFVLDGDDVMLTTAADSLKGRALTRDPRASLSVDDQAPPYSFVVMHGTAQLSADPAELLRWATAVGARYMGADRAAEFGRRNAVPGELLVRFRPANTVALAQVTG